MLKEFEKKQEAGGHMEDSSEDAADSYPVKEPRKKSAPDPKGSALILKKKKPTNEDNENLALTPEEKKKSKRYLKTAPDIKVKTDEQLAEMSCSDRIAYYEEIRKEIGEVYLGWYEHREFFQQKKKTHLEKKEK